MDGKRGVVFNPGESLLRDGCFDLAIHHHTSRGIMAIVKTQDFHLPNLPLAFDPIDPKTMALLHLPVFARTRDQQTTNLPFLHAFRVRNLRS